MKIEKYNLLGVEITPMSIKEMHALINDSIENTARKCIIASQNLHSIHVYHHDEKMRLFHQTAYKRVDGMPLILWGKLLGYPLSRQQRVTWVDWINPFMKEAVKSGWKIFYLGSSPETAKIAVKKLRKRHRGVRLNYSHGFFDSRLESRENIDVLKKINESAADILLVGMGMPRQEHWVYDNIKNINSKVILTCGAAMEYVAGAVGNPPRWMGKIGLEWLYRFCEQPKRFWSRYVFEPWFLLPIALKDITDKISLSGQFRIQKPDEATS
jgi:N-acetylglucosaminyldiphosphoundecaprenol N-acetyl-beta-D-mannosaminyltransferase